MLGGGGEAPWQNKYAGRSNSYVGMKGQLNRIENQQIYAQKLECGEKQPKYPSPGGGTRPPPPPPPGGTSLGVQARLDSWMIYYMYNILLN